MILNVIKENIMKKTVFIYFFLLVTVFPLYLIAQKSTTFFMNSRQSCTIIYASDSKMVLAGNNEDYNNPFTKIWFLPAKDGKYGRVYFGFDSFMPQGGMNDKGLFFDAAFVAKIIDVPMDPSKPVHKGQLILKAMAECRTVEEVLKLFNYYDFSGKGGGQYLIGDRFGNSAIIEPQAVIRKKDNYQIVTNFYQSEIKPEDFTCERYKIASDLFKKSEKTSLELFRSVLAATHQEGKYPTLYSNIYDLKNGLIYLYHFHNFQNVVVLDLKEELKKGVLFYDLPSLFPKTFTANRYLKQKTEEFKKLLKKRGYITDIDPQIIENYAGRYEVPVEMRLPEGSSVKLTRIDNCLTMILSEQYDIKVYKLYPTSETDFFYMHSDGGGFFKISFIEKDAEDAIRFILEKEGQKSTLKRIGS